MPSDKVRRRFEDKNQAIDWAAKIETYVAGLGLRRNLQETVLKPEQIRDAETAINLLGESRVKLTDLVREYINSGRASLQMGKKFTEAEAEFLHQLEAVQGLSPRTIEEKRQRLSAYRQYTDVRTLSDFTIKSAELFLARKKKSDGKGEKKPEELSLQTRRNDRATLHAFGNYLVARGYMERNPISGMAAPVPHWKPPSIITPEDAERLLRAAAEDVPSNGKHTLWFAVCLFAGLRPQADITGLVIGENIILHEDSALQEVRVFREKRRGASQRTVPIEPNLCKWLLWAKEREMSIVRPHGVCFRRIRMAAGIKTWKEDTMRHSYATYQLGKGANEANLSTWMGNSVSTLRQKYLNLAKHRKEDAQRYWAIVPGELTPIDHEAVELS